MPELRKRRSHLALLGVFAMVASVLAAVGSAPVSAEAGKADAAASYSACVGPATADAGFEDVAAGSVHDAAVNCIAYYGITRGTSATMFSPGRSISRWQLAVMLQRAAGPAGVDLPAAADVGFADIGDLGSSFQAAVNQMASLGVMSGTTATSFNPNAVVSRAGIAVALAQFLTKAQVGPGGRALSAGTDGTFTIKEDGSASAGTINIDETFRDIGSVPYATYQAIRALAEMGVVQGRGDQTFSPAGSVTRAQAAAFITRALAHTNARPAGLTMQTGKSSVTADDEVMLSISLRGDDFSVRDSAVVDVFSHTMEDAASAFNADGTCNSGAGGVTGVGAGGSAACTIELSDEVTEPDGNLLVEVGTAPSKDTQYWAWTGSTGASLDWDSSDLSRDNTAVSDAASVSVSVTEAAANAVVSLSIPAEAAEDGSTARYGTTVTVTVQLMGSNNRPIGVSGQTYTWHATAMHTQWKGAPDPIDADAAASGSPSIAGTGTKTITTDANGRATFTLTQADPNTSGDDKDDQTIWSYNIAQGTGAALASAGHGGGFESGSGTIVFDDDPGTAQSVTLSLQRTWTLVQTNTPRVGVTGKVTDQYGRPLRNHPMYFDLDGDTTYGCATPPDTCGSGDESIGATGDADAGDIGGTVKRASRSNGTNTVQASLPSDYSSTKKGWRDYFVGADLNGDGDVSDTGEMRRWAHFWVEAPPVDANTGAMSSQVLEDLIPYGISEYDAERNAIIRGDGRSSVTPGRWDIRYAFVYDDDDIFWYFADNDGNIGTPPNKDHEPTEYRWLTAAGFEARYAPYVANLTKDWDDRNANSEIGSHLVVLQYNTKTGISAFRVTVAMGTPLDPPTSG